MADAEPCIQRFVALLPGPLVEQRIISHGETSTVSEATYARIIEAVISAPGDSPLLDKLFVVEGGTFGMFSESLAVLTNSVKREGFPSSKLERNVRLLKKLITSDAFVSAVVDICLCGSKNSETFRVIALKNWDETSQNLISLPSKIANKYEKLAPNVFQIDTFSKYIFSHLAKAIGILYNVNSILYEVDCTPVSTVLSKLINNFSTENSAEMFVQIMSLWSKERPNFNSLISDIFLKLEQRSTERAAYLILQSCDASISNILGNCILQSSWRYVLCNKLPFLTFNSNDNIIINLVKYLGNLEDKTILSNVLSDLLRVWSDKSSLNHAPYDQHLYITKLILLAVNYLLDYIKSNSTLKAELKGRILRGVSIHLESTVENLRIIGMVTAESCVSMLGENNDNVLEFDYTGIKPNQAEVLDELKKYANYDFKNDSLISDVTGDELLEKFLEKVPTELKRSPPKSNLHSLSQIQSDDKNVEEADMNEELDSDDEFEPYDTSNDVKAVSLKKPKYLRDLIDLLNEEKDLDLWEECIKVAEELVVGQLPSDDSSLAVGLLDLLLCLDNKFSVHDFDQYRFNACVAIVMIKPEETAEHLGREFNTVQKYSVAVKNLMLDILSTAAQNLSKPSKEKVAEQKVREKIIGQVKRKISKTVIKKGSENKFTCAGSFIFPLIRGQSFKTMQEMPLLLAAALRSVAIMTSCCQNLGQLTIRICREVLELAWVMRYHQEITVRSGAVACVASVLLAAPGMLDQVSYELMEAQEWLAELVHFESDASLRGFAAHVLLLVERPRGLNEFFDNR